MSDFRIVQMNIEKLKPYENNPRFNDKAVDAVANSIENFGFKVPIVVDKYNVIVTGHTRLKAAQKLGLAQVPVIVADDLSEEKIKAFRLADNKVSELAEWDFSKLEAELAGLEMDMSQFNFDDMPEPSKLDRYDNFEHGALAKKFVIPPFTILDTRSGDWLERKRMWREKIQDNGDARSNAKPYTSLTGGDFGDASLLDPVLSELMVKWFMPKEENGVNCFDCFAGDTIFGFVSSYLGKNFTGIELREEQADFNNSRVNAFNLPAKYICDDGRNVLNHIKPETQDLFFSCPPYFDLEVYSDKENDASNQKTYDEFYAILDTAFTNAIKCLKNNRFAVVVVGDVRNERTGAYYDFMGSVKETFKREGMLLYNEMILINSFGTAGFRAASSMKYRKITKVHQNVLVFYKGDQKSIKDLFGEVEVGEINESEN